MCVDVVLFDCAIALRYVTLALSVRYIPIEYDDN